MQPDGRRGRVLANADPCIWGTHFPLCLELCFPLGMGPYFSVEGREGGTEFDYMPAVVFKRRGITLARLHFG
jgi:hypothetical protein